MANLFMFVEQQSGWLHVEVIAQHTKLEFAHQMKCLVEERYPEAEGVRITLGNLNTPLDSHQSHCPSQKIRSSAATRLLDMRQIARVAKFDLEETFANVMSDLSEYGTCQKCKRSTGYLKLDENPGRLIFCEGQQR